MLLATRTFAYDFGLVNKFVDYSIYLSINYYYYYYYYYYYFTPWEFFTSALADGFPLEFEWHQVFSSLLDSSQYSGQSQQCCSLDSLHLSHYFQVLQSLYQSFGDCIKSTNYNWYNSHFHISTDFSITE